MWVPTRNTSDQTPQPCRFHCSWAGPDRAGQVPSRRSILEAGRGGYTQDPFGPIEANPCRISLAIRPPTIVASTCAVPQSGLAAWGKKPITRRQRNALVSIPPCSSAASFPFRSFRPSGRHMQSASRSRVIQSVRGEGRGCQTSANAIESGRVQLGVGVAGVRSPVGHSMLILECAGTLVPVTVSVPPHCATDDAENTGTLGQNWSHLTDGRCHNDVIP